MLRVVPRSLFYVGGVLVFQSTRTRAETALTSPRIPHLHDEYSDLTLTSVHIYHRHGDRTPVCLKGLSDYHLSRIRSYWADVLFEDPEHEFLVDESDGIDGKRRRWSDLNDSEWLPGLRLVPFEEGYEMEHVSDATRYSSDYIKGQLTTRGREQLHLLGNELRQHYVNELGFLEDSTLKDDLFITSTNVRRTIFSVTELLLGLSPLHTRKSDFDVHVRRLSDEILYPCHCRRLNKELVKISQSEAYMKSNRRSDMLGQALQHAFGISPNCEDRHKRRVSWMQLRDLVDTHRAYKEHYEEKHGEADLLMDWVDTDAIQAKVREENALRWDLRYSTAITKRLGIGRALDELLGRLQNKASKKLYVYSAHDTSLFVLLKALGKDCRKIWPPYASFIIVEKYLKRNSGEEFVRLIYNGEEFGLPGKPPLSPMAEFEAYLRPLIPMNFDAECEN